MTAVVAATVDYRYGEPLRLMARGRPVWRTWFAGQRYVYVFGPEANAFVLSHDHLFRWREAFQALVPVDGPTALIVSDGDDHARRRALVRPAMHHRQVSSYVPAIAATADEALARVRPGVPFDAYQLFRGAIRRSTLRTLFGEQIGSDTDRLGRLLDPLLEVVSLLPDAIGWHQRLGTPLWRRAMAARVELDAYVGAMIARGREARLSDESPTLDLLVHGRDGTGSGLSETEIRDQVVSLIAAGYETTSAAMAWTLYGLASRPELMQQARDEVLQVCGESPPTPADVTRLELTGAVVTEALRLYPPATVSARYVVDDIDVLGRRVEGGTLLLYSPYVTHRDPQVYDEPRSFKPERWLGGARRPVEEYLPFGGGSHRCIGSPMATAELTVMLARLLTRGLYEVRPGPVRPVTMAAMRPKGGLEVRLIGGLP